MSRAKKRTVVRFRCEHGHDYESRKDAEACCVCPECGKPHPTERGGRVYCEQCTAISDAQRSRSSLESAALNYAFSIQKLRAVAQDKYISLEAIERKQRKLP